MTTPEVPAVGEVVPEVTDISEAVKGVFWHGSPSGELVGGASGLHVGTQEAAKQALEARIGIPVEGSWDGTRIYGETLLMGKDTMEARGITPTGYNTHAPAEDYLPTGGAKFADSSAVSLSSKPDIFPVKIKGPMTNRPQSAYEDYKATGYVSGQLKRGRAKSGAFYVNIGEDEGSISAVLPSGEHIERITEPIVKPPTVKPPVEVPEVVEIPKMEGFGTKTDIPAIDSALAKPEYYATEKNEVVTIEIMSPSEYLDRADKILGLTREESLRVIEQELVDRYSKMMQEGVDFNVPYLDYKRGEQEGRQRAYAAQKAGITEMPVAIVRVAKPPAVKSWAESKLAEFNPPKQSSRGNLRKMVSEIEPMPPDKGPPLPKGLGLKWPWRK